MTPATPPTPPNDAAPPMFPEQVTLRLCSANVCTNGHEWIPKVALLKCGYGTAQGWNGCGAPVLAVKQEGCPVCNEPVAAMRFRSDHTAPTPFIIPLCIPNSVSPAECTEILLKRDITKVETDYEAKFPALPVPDAPVDAAKETK